MERCETVTRYDQAEFAHRGYRTRRGKERALWTAETQSGQKSIAGEAGCGDAPL